MSRGTLPLIVVIVMLAGGMPTWRHSRNWRYAPSSVLGLVVIILRHRAPADGPTLKRWSIASRGQVT